MKYYKPKFKNEKKLYKERIKKYTKRQKRNYYLNTLITFFAFSSFIILAVTTYCFLKNSNEELMSIILWGLLLIFLTFIVICLIQLANKFFHIEKIPAISKEMFKKVNQNKLKFYKLNDHFIITKCYDSSNGQLKNHDVIIFFNNQKLRIINDLFSSIYDFGCYEFDLIELSIYNIKDDCKIKTMIQSKNDYFILGYKAKTFINNFQSNKYE